MRQRSTRDQLFIAVLLVFCLFQSTIASFKQEVAQLGIPVSEGALKDAQDVILAAWSRNTALIQEQLPDRVTEARALLKSALGHTIAAKVVESTGAIHQRLNEWLFELKAKLSQCRDVPLYRSSLYETCVEGVYQDWGNAEKKVRAAWLELRRLVGPAVTACMLCCPFSSRNSTPPKRELRTKLARLACRTLPRTWRSNVPYVLSVALTLHAVH